MERKPEPEITHERPKGRSWSDRKNRHGGTPAKPAPKRNTAVFAVPVQALTTQQLIECQALVNRELASRKVANADQLSTLNPVQLIVVTNMFRAQVADLHQRNSELEKQLKKAQFDLNTATWKRDKAKAS